MPVATMTSKGQITIPKELRDDLGLEAGSKVMFVKVGDGHYRIMRRSGRVTDLAGILHDPARPTMTVDDMNEAIADGGAASGLQDREAPNAKGAG